MQFVKNKNIKLKFIVFSILILSFFSSKAQNNNEQNFLSQTRQLIYDGKRSGEGYFSEDGRYLIFQSEREKENPFYQIYILDFETGDINRVSPGTGKTTCSFFQYGGGKKVLFASSHADKDALQKQKLEIEDRASGNEKKYSWDYEPEMDIYIADRNGKNLKNLTNAYGYDAEGAFSPDGKKIIFASNRNIYKKSKLTEKEKKRLKIDPSYFCDVFIMDADGSNVKQLTDESGYDGGTFFSPDGKKVIWRKFNEDGDKADVYTMNVDGSAKKQITDFNAMSWAPYYHPTQEYIIFASNKYGFGNFELFIVDAEGEKEPIRITTTDGFDGLPVFSPDGKKLVWTSTRTSDKKAQLFIANWNHEAALQALKLAPKKNQSKVLSNQKLVSGNLKNYIEFLASDELKGRMTGSESIKKAANYIIEKLQANGLKPLQESFKWSFSFVSDYSYKKSANTLQLALKSKTTNYQLDKDFIPLPSTKSGEFEGMAVFAGFGIKYSDKDLEYNSYKDLDVKDKVVFLLNGSPEIPNKENKIALERVSSAGHKMMLAKSLGAKAVIFINESLEKPKYDLMIQNTGLFTLSMSFEKAKEFFQIYQFDLQEASEKLKNTEKTPKDWNMKTHLTLKGNVNISIKKQFDNNIVGMLPALTESNEYIFLGAHYDHLGLGEVNSRSDASHKAFIHNGADDNASGVALVLSLADQLSELKKKQPDLFTKNVVFAFWSGEELGLLGSSAFCEKLTISSEKIKAYLNFDMVGRMKNNKLSLQGLGSASEWKKIIEKKNFKAGFNLALSESPYLPTDATSFYLKKVPILSFFTGIHDEYHTYADDASLINYKDTERIRDFAQNIVLELMKAKLTYQTFTGKGSTSSKGSRKIYLGTIPSYSSGDVEGVKISGVQSGSPAEKAGLKAGDILIGLKEKPIKNIYDFSNLLRELKIGEKTKMQVMRDGKKMDLEIIPSEKK